ncbi:hypothetical protein T484DRAFT_1806664, partial [Baffinella frigidus]
MAVFTTGSISTAMQYTGSGDEVDDELDVPLMAGSARPARTRNRMSKIQRWNRPQYMVGAAVLVLFTVGIILVSKKSGGDRKAASQQASDWALRTTVAQELRHLARRRAEDDNRGGVTTGWGDDDVRMNADSGGAALPRERERARSDQDQARSRLGAKRAAPHLSSTATATGGHAAVGGGGGEALRKGGGGEKGEKVGEKGAALSNLSKKQAMQRMNDVIKDKNAK